jgi:hypothetical protein
VLLAAPARVGAALLVTACGGTLGDRLGEGVRDLPDVACAIQAADLEDQNYAAAAGEALNGLPFAGGAADDLSRPAVRRAVFRARLADLERQRAILAGMAPAGDTERALVDAARADLAAAVRLVRYDLRFAPGDPDAPLPPEAGVERLDAALAEASAEIQGEFSGCEVPPDTGRRQRAYGGG